MDEVIIIGAGLTGLSLGYLLSKAGIRYRILEARDRPGGRIYTVERKDQAPVEMGATWLGKKHKSLTNLLAELGLDTFRQELGVRAIYEPISTSPHQIVQLPPNNDPSFRIKGGTHQLISKLISVTGESNVYYNEPVLAIDAEGDTVKVRSQKQTYQAKKVVSTLPPYLLLKTIKLQPLLPKEVRSIMHSTHTWMGESIKVALSFEKPFWRTEKSSGTLFSNVGPIPEMYDHSDYEDSRYALKGFLNGNYFTFSKEERLELVMNQLQKYYGESIKNYTTYEELVWRKEPFTFSPYESHVLPHQNNGHPIYRSSFFEGKLLIGGAETAQIHPGYMDGAISSSIDMSTRILENRV